MWLENTAAEANNTAMNIDSLYPSRWLKAADLVKPVLVTISHVVVEEIADGESKPVLHFTDDTSMVLNKTNKEMVKEMLGSETDNWSGKQVVLFVEKVPYQGKMVPAIRIRAPRNQPPQPSRRPAAMPAPAPEPDDFATPSATDDDNF